MSDIIALFQEYGFSPRKKTESEWSCACPSCGGTKRCSIWPAEREGRGYYWCRECNARGDSIQFLRDYAHFSYADACKRIGVASAAPAVRTPALPGRAERNCFEVGQKANGSMDAGKWREKAEKFVSWAEARLQKNAEQLAWLAARGISAEAAREYRLGYNPGERGGNCIIRPRESWGLPPAVRDDGKPKRLWLPRGIVIPQMLDGEIRRLRIRRLDADRAEFNAGHKYHVVEGSEMQPLWLECRTQLRDGQGAVVVVETELDACMLHALAGDLVHALALGTCNVRHLPARLFERLKESLVILVALDADEAGAQGWPRWQETFPAARRWPVPVGKDPGDAYARGEDMRLWLLSGMPEGLRMMLDRRQPESVPEEAPAQEETPAAETPLPDDSEQAPCSLPSAVDAKTCPPDLPPAAVLEWWEMWKRIPVTYFRERDKEGNVCGFEFVCPYQWSRSHPGVMNDFLAFRDEHPETWYWLARNRNEEITAKNFMDVI